MTTALPTDVHFGVTGQDLTLTCTTSETGLTKFAFYNDANEVQQAFGSSNTYTTQTADSYYCIAANEDESQKTAKTAEVTLEFKSKSFHIHHLSDK